MRMEDSNKKCMVITFGCNDDGQLGRGEAKIRKSTAIDCSEISETNYPTRVSFPIGNSRIVAVSCGSRHTMALTNTGDVFSWGWGKMGQLGLGSDKSVTCPTKVEYFSNMGITIKYISGGGCHSGAISKQGEVYMWGESSWGQLGISRLEHKDQHQMLPVKCDILHETDGNTLNVKQLSCGGTHTVALTDAGTVYAWGRGDNGQLGVGKAWLEKEDATEDRILSLHRPQLVQGFDGERIKQVACGAFHTAALSESGNVYIWGKEDYGMLGVGHTSDISTPQKLKTFLSNPASHVSCGGWHTVIVTESGESFASGRGEYNRLGLGDSKSRIWPEKIKHLQGEVVRQAACGGTHTLFCTSDGKAFSVGRTDHARLGYTDTNTSALPCRINFESLQGSEQANISVIQVSTGGAHSVALCTLK